MQPPQAPGYNSSFDPQTAKANQEADQYKKVRGVMLIIAGLAAFVAFMAELRSWFVFGDWLNSHEWTSHEALGALVNWLVEAFPLFFLVFGLFGIYALFMKDELAKSIRIIFLVFAVPMLLLPLLRGETKRVLLIGLAVCIYFTSRWLADWAYNQRPRDWKIILAERKRLGLGPDEFARALVKGRASDGNPLAVIVSSGDTLPGRENIHEKIDSLMHRGAYAELKAALPPQYHPMGSMLRLAIKQRFPRALNSRDCLTREGISSGEQDSLAESSLYAHEEIAERVKPIIGLR
jgi:hypothetical protein